jgi:hypothetical protein
MVKYTTPVTGWTLTYSLPDTEENGLSESTVASVGVPVA